MVNDFHSTRMSNISPDLPSSPFHLFRNKILHENIQYQHAKETTSFENLNQTKTQHVWQ